MTEKLDLIAEGFASFAYSRGIRWTSTAIVLSRDGELYSSVHGSSNLRPDKNMERDKYVLVGEVGSVRWERFKGVSDEDFEKAKKYSENGRLK